MNIRVTENSRVWLSVYGLKARRAFNGMLNMAYEMRKNLKGKSGISIDIINKFFENVAHNSASHSLNSESSIFRIGCNGEVYVKLKPRPLQSHISITPDEVISTFAYTCIDLLNQKFNRKGFLIVQSIFPDSLDISLPVDVTDPIVLQDGCDDIEETAWKYETFSVNELICLILQLFGESQSLERFSDYARKIIGTPYDPFLTEKLKMMTAQWKEADEKKKSAIYLEWRKSLK